MSRVYPSGSLSLAATPTAPISVLARPGRAAADRAESLLGFEGRDGSTKAEAPQREGTGPDDDE